MCARARGSCCGVLPFPGAITTLIGRGGVGVCVCASEAAIMRGGAAHDEPRPSKLSADTSSSSARRLRAIITIHLSTFRCGVLVCVAREAARSTPYVTSRPRPRADGNYYTENMWLIYPHQATPGANREIVI